MSIKELEALLELEESAWLERKRVEAHLERVNEEWEKACSAVREWTEINGAKA